MSQHSMFRHYFYEEHVLESNNRNSLEVYGHSCHPHQRYSAQKV